ncbi:hypothetical protein HRW14_03485 [Streptomyces lunaelactis]|uniref:hypothetical protein n=1 Tax=Streptomyces lunaelactis TaxID=1535768 RepID=UPI001584D2B7|nr:hypothetical protein [Streptomyces lunaelactis]NUK00444.1 hypothetical protein [Streptomyces lunaelactis]NUK13820.1 hypothetical protein [Streptomyces lunaelactis]NUK22254.1 hypothetical protein [Streptomyces lunaelactis]NUK32463.1 hypothetical protein [Streptomyces lunaelactis]NUK39480.1 hypothetical protein [Streptomyces lunaelactis]
MDLESIADELYGLPPTDFTGARTRHAAAARTAGDRDLAGKIGALRRPTLSAWASNLLVRGEPDAVGGLLRLGEGLREAHQELDRKQLRELSGQQHRLTAALARQARQLAADAGHPVSEEVQREVELTLHAVLADPQAAQEWAVGRLVKPLTPPVGFPTAAVRGTPQRAAGSPSPRSGRPAGRDTDKSPDRSAKDQRREAERMKKLAQARQAAETAGQQAHQREDELRQAESERDQAERQLHEAEERTTALTQEVKAAQEHQREARSALDQARHRATDAARTARTARGGAQAAHARAERLEADEK